MKKHSNYQQERNGVILAVILMAVIALLGKLTTSTPQWLTAKNSLSFVLLLFAAAVIVLTAALYKKVYAIKSNSKKVNSKI